MIFSLICKNCILRPECEASTWLALAAIRFINDNDWRLTWSHSETKGSSGDFQVRLIVRVLFMTMGSLSKRSIRHLLKSNIFLGMIMFCAIMAAAVPRLGTIDGPLAPQLTAGLIAPWLVYFSAGVVILPDELTANICHMKLIGTILIISLLAVPAFTTLCSVFSAGLSSWVWSGMSLMSCLPGSIPTGLVLVGCARGNQAAAVISGVTTSIAAVFVSPLVLFLVHGSTTSLPLYVTLEMIFVNVVAPFALGQLVHLAGEWPRALWLGAKLDRLSQPALIYCLYISFCETFSTLRVDVSAQTLIVTLAIVVILQVATTIMVYLVATRLQFSKADRVAIVFCCVQKGTALGIPMVRLLYSGLHHMDEVMLPLLLAGPVQAIVGSLAASALKQGH